MYAYLLMLCNCSDVGLPISAIKNLLYIGYCCSLTFAKYVNASRPGITYKQIHRHSTSLIMLKLHLGRVETASMKMKVQSIKPNVSE